MSGTGGFSANLRDLEAKVRDAEYRLLSDEQRMAAIEQRLWQLWGALATPPETQAFGFVVSGCGGATLANATVEISAYGGISGVTDIDGNLTLNVPTAFLLSVPFTVTADSARYATYSGNTNADGSVNTVTLAPASGYACLVAPDGTPCTYPIKTSLRLYDPNADKGSGATYTLTYVPAGGGTTNFGAPFGTAISPPDGPYWYAIDAYHFAAQPSIPCPSIGGVPVVYILYPYSSSGYARWGQPIVDIFYGTANPTHLYCPYTPSTNYLLATSWTIPCPPAATALHTYSLTWQGGPGTGYFYVGGIPSYGPITLTET